MTAQPSEFTNVASAEQISAWFDISVRQVHKLVQSEVLAKDKNGKFPVKENVQRWIQYKTPSESLEVDGLDEAALDLRIKREDLRRKARENDEASGVSVRKQDLLPFFRNYSKQVNREFDSIEGQLDGTLIECGSCDNSMRLDGRGRQRIRETVIRIKNHLDDLHNNLEGARSK